MEGVLVPPARVLLHVEVRHRRLHHLLVRRAALDAVVERQVVLAVVELALEAEADEVDEEPEQRHVDEAAQPLAERERADHRDVAGDEGPRHEVAALELDGWPRRRVQHLADPDRGLEQRVHRREEDPELPRHGRGGTQGW